MTTTSLVARAFGRAALGTLLSVSIAVALPIELRDGNGTRYQVNTDIDPLVRQSTASGALSDATFIKPVTVTSYWIGFTPWFGWTTVYTVQWTVDVPLTNAFLGFNGLLVTAVNDATLAEPLVYNPGDIPAGEDCPQKNTNRQIVFQTQAFPAVDLAITRKVFVPHNGEFARWLNVVTNTGTETVEVALTLRGQLGSGTDTRVTATSSGGSSVGKGELWFATEEATPANTFSTIPRIGFVMQGVGAPAPVTAAGLNGLGTTAVTYTPTIAPGESAIVLTFVTVQGNSKQTKAVSQNLVELPSVAITCLTQDELRQVVNFASIVEPELKKAKIELKFKEKKVDKDVVKWKGDVTIGAGTSLEGLPMTVDIGGAVRSFVLDKKGKGTDGAGSKVRIKAKLDENDLTKADTVKYKVTLKGNFKDALEAYGLVDETVSDVLVTVPVSVSVAGRTHAGEQTLVYQAKQGKSGKAKLAS